METKICNEGFCIPKNKLSNQQIHKIKTELRVTPFSNFGNFSVKSFNVYRENSDYFILPIHYVLQNLNLNGYSITFPGSVPLSITDTIELRENQKDCFNNCIKEFDKPFGGGIITLSTGQGKCLAPGTKVIMYDGTLKKVEDLKQGELLMGDDNTPRRILTLTKGFHKMYDIIPVKGPKHTVNKAHILVVKNSMKSPEITYRSSHGRIRSNVIWWEDNKLQNKLFKTEEEALQFKEEITSKHQLYSELNIGDWLKTSRAFRNTFRAYRVPIDFPEKKVIGDPYEFNFKVNENIPYEYKCNTKEKRLELVAGILDKLSQFDKEQNLLYFFMDLEKENFIEDFLFICRSVGLYSFHYKLQGKYKVTIQGNLLEIPLRKGVILKEFNKKDIEKDWSMTVMKVKFKERGEYYGFTLDGNKRFLFYDFTVTHNTVVSLKLIASSKKKTLVIVNKIELLNQWKKEIEKWLPDVKIGIIQGSKFDYEDCDIVLGMLQTITIKENLKAIDFGWVNLCIIDETHNIGSEIFSNIMFKIRPQYIFGLTATLDRKDKLEKIIKWYMGDVLYDGTNKNLKQSTEVYILKYEGVSSIEKTLRDGTAAVASMLTNISLDKQRNDYIINILNQLVNNDDNRNILVISDRIAQLKYINKNIGNEKSGLFIGSMKSVDLDKSKEKRIVLGTYALVNEGFNLPKLNCLLFATPRSSIVQAIGRIYRKTHDITPIIIDVFDNFSIFKGQHYRRRKIYQQSIKDCFIISKELDSKKLINEKEYRYQEKNDKLSTVCLLDYD